MHFSTKCHQNNTNLKTTVKSQAWLHDYMAHACNPSIWVSEAGESLRVQGQDELHSVTLSVKDWKQTKQSKTPRQRRIPFRMARMYNADDLTAQRGGVISPCKIHIECYPITSPPKITSLGDQCCGKPCYPWTPRCYQRLSSAASTLAWEVASWRISLAGSRPASAGSDVTSARRPGRMGFFRASAFSWRVCSASYPQWPGPEGGATRWPS